MLRDGIKVLRVQAGVLRGFRRRIKRHLGVLDPLRIDLYGGYGGSLQSVVWGRALEDEVPTAPRPGDSLFDNALRALRQFESDEVPGVGLKLLVEGCDQELVAETDSEGFFCLEFQNALGGDGFVPDSMTRAGEPLWWPIQAEVTSAPKGATLGPVAAGSLLVPSECARFGVVSDIDDTILQSHVRNRFKQAWVTLAGNALQRKSFPETAAFYQALQRAAETGPFFYLSRSAWNVHDLLQRFVREQGLPSGPLILRDVDLLPRAEKRFSGHKSQEIRRILRTFPGLPLVLIGDSGQADADIYLDVARAFPERILAILIRNVSSRRRARALRRQFARECPQATYFCVFDEAAEAERACRQWGLAR